MAAHENNRMTHAAAIRCNQLLATLLVKDGNYYSYKEGHDDESLAKQLGVARSSVKKLRTELYGQLKSSSQGPFANFMEKFTEEASALREQVIVLSQIVQQQSNTISELVTKHNNVCRELEMNRVLGSTKHHLAMQLPRPNGAAQQAQN